MAEDDKSEEKPTEKKAVAVKKSDDAPKKAAASATPATAPSFFQSTWGKAIVVGAIFAAGGYIYKRANRPAVTMDQIAAANLVLTIGGGDFGDAPKCPEGATGEPARACLDSIATYLGSRNGFHGDKPDQASCATAAIVVARDKRGDMVPDSNAWINMLKTGKGLGPDALRASVARSMADAAPEVGKQFDDEDAAKKLIAAVARAIPGACDTYGDIARGKPLEQMPPEEHPDHSACVQRDLSRREGPGGRYGTGIFRAAEGAAALWREEERFLRMGQGLASPAVQKLIAEKLPLIEPFTVKISIKKIANTDENQMTQFIGAVHAEAGVILWKMDGGAGDGGVDGGATDTPKPIPRPPR